MGYKVANDKGEEYFPNLKSVLSRDKTSLGSYFFKDEFKLCRTELKQLGLFRLRQDLAAVSPAQHIPQTYLCSDLASPTPSPHMSLSSPL